MGAVDKFQGEVGLRQRGASRFILATAPHRLKNEWEPAGVPPRLRIFSLVYRQGVLQKIPFTLAALPGQSTGQSARQCQQGSQLSRIVI